MTFAELATASKEDILKTPVKDLGIQIPTSLIEPAIQKLFTELEAAGIQFRPDFYITDDWGCIDEAPMIGIPFYLFHPRLHELELEKMKMVETEDEVAQLFRHEAGHAFNYVYSLYRLPRWQEVFGKYNKPYRDNFAPIAGSDKFVRHLEGWYAQKHPDEDFAETFAVLLTPEFDWKRVYKGTPAFEKLQYVSDLIKEYKTMPVPLLVKPAELDVPIESLALPLEEWYQKRSTLQQQPNKKVLLLFYQEYPKRIPTHDEVVDQIKDVILGLPGYSAVLLPINQSIDRITQGVRLEKPDLIFNLCEMFRNNDRFDMNVTALLEMLQIPMTGSSSGSLFISNDKYLSKKIFDFHKIPYPAFVFVPRGQEAGIPKSMKFPLFVKPVHEDASIGIDEHSVVRDDYAMREKIAQIHKEIRDDALVEEYIDGREFFISVLGNRIPKTLEIVELDFTRVPPHIPKIYSFKVKFAPESEEYQSMDFVIPRDISSELRTKLKDLGVRVHKALGARDYSRVDIRMTPDGKLYVLEANLNPYIAKGAEVIIAAEQVGLSYEKLITTIIEMAFARAGK